MTAPAVADPPPERPSSPYRGLRPYEEADAAFFFGREAEGENVEANLFSIPAHPPVRPERCGQAALVLLAGVARFSTPALPGVPSRAGPAALFAVVVVRSWSDAKPLSDYRRRDTSCGHGAARPTAPSPTRPPAPTLAEVLDQLERLQVHGKLLVLFDQFEEYFLYHGQESLARHLRPEFPLRSTGPTCGELSALDSGRLARPLDRFKGRIPTCSRTGSRSTT